MIVTSAMDPWLALIRTFQISSPVVVGILGKVRKSAVPKVHAGFLTPDRVGFLDGGLARIWEIC